MTADALLERAIVEFRRHFGAAPTHGAMAPGRVNLIGEHTDYNEGFVLPFAIDRAAVILARPRGASRSRVWAADIEAGAEIDLRDPRPLGHGHFANYLAGVARQFVDQGAAVGELDLLLVSSIPIGCGLSSSAAVTVAMATLLEDLCGLHLGVLEKARVCQRAEHAFAGTPCGIMDMLISAAAVSGCALLIDCRNHRCEPVPMPHPSQAIVLVVDTGVARALAGSAYAERRSACESAAAQLGLASLREATTDMLDRAALPPVLARRARHVIDENERTLRAAAALRGGDLETLGTLMFESHASLRDRFEVSCPELDRVVESAAALRGAGVLGARMTGAGFGGCAIVLCRTDRVDPVAARLQADFTAAFGRPPRVFPVSPAGGARPLEMPVHGDGAR